jgi:hypothetical protein
LSVGTLLTAVGYVLSGAGMLSGALGSSGSGRRGGVFGAPVAAPTPPTAPRLAPPHRGPTPPPGPVPPGGSWVAAAPRHRAPQVRYDPVLGAGGPLPYAPQFPAGAVTSQHPWMPNAPQGFSRVEVDAHDVRPHPDGVAGAWANVGGFVRSARVTEHKAHTIDERVHHIVILIRKGAVDPRVRQLAQSVLARKCGNTWCVPEKDWKAEADALFGFVRQNVRYTKDPAVADLFTSAPRTLFDRPDPALGAIGDCDDFTITLGSLLASVGHNVKVRVGAIRPPGSRGSAPPNHVWLVDVLPGGGGAVTFGKGREYPLDASVAMPPGWQAPRERVAGIWDTHVSAGD